MFPAFDVSTSALVAQRMRLNAISSNLANIATTRNEYGEPEAYSPRYVTFQADADLTTSAGGMGVKVASVDQSEAPPLMKFEPGHPDANSDGYVAYPNVDMTTEFVDALEATRAYEANIGVLEITKDMGQRTLQIIA
jgi:flagellar basal-body rod protein FlgC